MVLLQLLMTQRMFSVGNLDYNTKDHNRCMVVWIQLLCQL